MSRDLARRFPHLTFVAFDLSDWMLSFAAGLPRIRGDVRALPVPRPQRRLHHTTHFFHHLTARPDRRRAEGVRPRAKRGIIVTICFAGAASMFWIKLFTLWQQVRQVRRSQSCGRRLTIPEIEGLAQRAAWAGSKSPRIAGGRPRTTASSPTRSKATKVRWGNRLARSRLMSAAPEATSSTIAGPLDLTKVLRRRGGPPSQRLTKAR